MIELSIVIPALNEERTAGICVRKALKSIRALGLSGEVVVVDNGSTDRTAEISKELGARVVSVKSRGYGSACLAGFSDAKGKFIIMGDADDSYSFEEIAPFYEKLKQGYEFVLGNRFKGKIKKGAMPFLHRFLGTPVLTATMNLFFGTGAGDVNCGMRAFTKKAFRKMRLRSRGMEFATEMVIKASLLKMKIAEVPCNLYKDKRLRRPHLKTWSDGWRHLRFMLLFTATWTFLFPGLMLSFLGLGGMLLFLLRDIFHLSLLAWVGGKHVVSCLLVFLSGFQIIQLGLIAKTFSFSKRFDYASKVIRFLNEYFSLERGIILGLLMLVLGVFVFTYLQVSFYTSWLPRLTEPIRFDMAIFAVAGFLTGLQFIFCSFVLSLLYLKVK